MASPRKRRCIKSPSAASRAAPSFASRPKATLADLPLELLLLVGKYSIARSLMNLAKACKGYYYLLRHLVIEKDVQEKSGRSAVWACKEGNLEVLRVALQAGCSPLLSTRPHADLNIQGNTIATMCIRHKKDRVALLKELLTAGLNIHSGALLRRGKRLPDAPSILFMAQNPAMIAFLLAIGCQKHINSVSYGRNEPPMSPLARGVAHGLSRGALVVLLDAGADPAERIPQPSMRSNALHEAMHRGCHEAVRLFISRGASLNPTTNPLPFIHGPKGWNNIDEEHEEAVALKERLSVYVPLGLDVNQRCPVERIPLLYAAFHEKYNVEYVQTLLRWGADPRRAYHLPWNPFRDEPVRAFQALLLARRRWEGDIPRITSIERHIGKARAILAAQNVDAPETPSGYKSMLAWAIKAVPLYELERSVRTLDPWMHKMRSDESVAADLQNRLNDNDPEAWRVRQRGRIINRVEGHLRELKVPGFVKDYRSILRDRSKSGAA